MKSKKADFNIVLLFAIIAGTAVLLLALYGVFKVADTKATQIDTETAKYLQVLADPMQSGIFDATTSTMRTNRETLISAQCVEDEKFGSNKIFVQTDFSAGVKNAFNQIGVSVPNKYIFSDEKKAKIFYIFSKPFESPFKIADFIFITSNDYCFVNPPEEIKSEIESLQIKNIKVYSSTNNSCAENSLNVCFGQQGVCDIYVYGQCEECDSKYEYGVVEKEDEKLQYSSSLMYAAILSPSAEYECNVKRVLARLSSISGIFADKTDRMNARGCNSLLKNDLLILSSISNQMSLETLPEIYEISSKLQKEEGAENCKVW